MAAFQHWDSGALQVVFPKTLRKICSDLEAQQCLKEDSEQIMPIQFGMLSQI